jgi:hypothetical protein
MRNRRRKRFDSGSGREPPSQRSLLSGALRIGAVVVLTVVSGCSIQHAITYAPIPVSVIRLPVTVNPWTVGNLFEMDTDQGTEVNAPLKVVDRAALTHVADALARGESRSDAVEDQKFAREHFETFKDFTDRETLIFVTVSGGGARAEALGAHTMSLLEQKYNEIAFLYAKGRGLKSVVPMISQIDAYSSVSGGSIYVFHIALKFLPDSDRQHSSYRTGIEQCSEISENDTSRSFQEIACNASPSLQRLGLYTALMYFGTGLPLVTLGTDLDYLDIMAAGLDIFSRDNPSDIFPQIVTNVRNHKGILHMRTMGNLQTRASERPLFLFNATAIETGTPFVISQSLLHVPTDSLGRISARLDVNREEPPRLLPHAVTLEDINSSPAKFPLAFAAMASAAFPIGIEPLPVRKYGYKESVLQRYETDDLIHLADGGVYDNSGLVSAVDLFDFLRDPRIDRRGTRVKRLLLLSINAETTNYDLDYPGRVATPKRWYEGLLPFSMNWPTPFLPIRIGALGIKSLELIHFTNKTRAEQIALDHIQHLSQTPADDRQTSTANESGRQYDKGSPLFFFPVNLLQLSESDSLSIPGGESLFRKVKEIGTNYTVTDGEDALIAAAAKMLVSSRQAKGWNVGPECLAVDNGQRLKSTVFRLDEAFAFALLRSQQKDGWDAPLIGPGDKTSFLSQWCGEPRP